MATSQQSVECSSEEGYSDDEIDCWKLPKAIKVAKEKHIDLGKIEKLEEIRCHLKLHLLADKHHRDELITSFNTAASRDHDRRKELVKLYNETISKLYPVVDELNKFIPDFQKELETQKNKIDRHILRSPILVLGETGAGKSSFINLLLGKDILPCLLLSNTRVICEIEYGTKYSFKFFPHNPHVAKVEKTIDDFQNESEFFQTLAEHVQDRQYLKAEILLPLEILKTGLVIVDSPGIGDTEEMTDLTMSYLVEACAFIYIVNSSAAGGVQEDRLLKLLQVVAEKTFKVQCEYRPDCALFICNKWDQVPTFPRNERETVWNLTKDKIINHWQCSESQLFRLSTKEAAFIQKEGYVCGRFAKIISQINNLIPLSREILIQASFRQLLNFVNKAIICCSRHLVQETLSADKHDIQQKSKEKLEQLKEEVDDFFHCKEKYIESELKTVVEKLQKFLSEESNMKNLSSFSEEEIPKNRDWQNTTVAVRAKIYERYENLLHVWENENGDFQRIGCNVVQDFCLKLHKFDTSIHEVERNLLENIFRISDNNLSDENRERNNSTFSLDDLPVLSDLLDFNLETEEEPENSLIPSSIMNHFVGLNLGMKILLGISLSPVLLIGMVVMVPLYWKRELQRRLERSWLENKFCGAKDKDKQKKIVEQYAENITRKLVEPVFLKAVIKQSLQPVHDYIKEQHLKMHKLIDADLKLLNLKVEDTLKDKNRLVYEPLRLELEFLQRYLLHYQVTYLRRLQVEKPITMFEISNEIICNGLLSVIFQARSKDTGQLVAMRQNLIRLGAGNIKKYLEEENACRLINKSFLVKSQGIVKNLIIPGNELVIYSILAPLKCSLRRLISEKKKTNQPCLDIANIVSDVVNGLQFLHDRNMVHHDLSQDTIAVDENNIIKLTNTMCTKTLPNDYFQENSARQLSAYTHMSPEILNLPNFYKYMAKHDMYSVGILMFELACNKHAYQEEIDKEEINTLSDFVIYAKNNLPQTEKDITGRMSAPWRTTMVNCLHYSVQSKNW